MKNCHSPSLIPAVTRFRSKFCFAFMILPAHVAIVMMVIIDVISKSSENIECIECIYLDLLVRL